MGHSGTDRQEIEIRSKEKVSRAIYSVVFREVDIFKVSTFFLPEVLSISPNNKVVFFFPFSSFSLCICLWESPMKGWVTRVMYSPKDREY